MKITKKHLLSFILLLIFFFTPLFFNYSICPTKAGSFLDMANEGGLDEIGREAYKTTGEPKDIRIIATNIIKIFLGFLGLIFVVLIIVGGYKYMTAQGNEEKVKEAVGQIKVAVIGLAIILSSYAITHFIAERLRRGVTGSIW